MGVLKMLIFFLTSLMWSRSRGVRFTEKKIQVALRLKLLIYILDRASVESPPELKELISGTLWHHFIVVRPEAEPQVATLPKELSNLNREWREIVVDDRENTVKLLNDIIEKNRTASAIFTSKTDLILGLPSDFDDYYITIESSATITKAGLAYIRTWANAQYILITGLRIKWSEFSNINKVWCAIEFDDGETTVKLENNDNNVKSATATFTSGTDLPLDLPSDYNGYYITVEKGATITDAVSDYMCTWTNALNILVNGVSIKPKKLLNNNDLWAEMEFINGKNTIKLLNDRVEKRKIVSATFKSGTDLILDLPPDSQYYHIKFQDQAIITKASSIYICTWATAEFISIKASSIYEDNLPAFNAANELISELSKTTQPMIKLRQIVVTVYKHSYASLDVKSLLEKLKSTLQNLTLDCANIPRDIFQKLIDAKKDDIPEGWSCVPQKLTNQLMFMPTDSKSFYIPSNAR